MKTLRFAIITVAILGSVSVFATNARVESMGKNSTFIRDDISIFDNPANINFYPNFLIGELGIYTGKEAEAVGTGKNHDPWDPWFGGLFSLDIGAGKSLSIGGVFGRKEERLFKYFPDIIVGKDTSKTPIPVTNFDGFLGADLDGVAIGLHIYIAHQDGLTSDNKITSDAFVSAAQLDAGVSVEISDDHQLEISGGAARIQYGPSDHSLFDDELISFFANARMFSRLEAINGNLIPVASFRNMNAPGRDEMDISAGLGVDTKFDRGFFWLGLTGFYNVQNAYDNWDKKDGLYRFFDREKNDSKTSLWQLGGTISFGIEKNLWWPWFVLRVGGQKVIAYADYTTDRHDFPTSGRPNNNILCPSSNCYEDGNYFVTNPVNDGTRNDNVGFGFGVNVEEKLKIDASVSEDLLFRNPFQGGGRLLSRISATYSF